MNEMYWSYINQFVLNLNHKAQTYLTDKSKLKIIIIKITNGEKKKETR